MAENSAQMWALILEALAPDAFYTYSYAAAVAISALSPLLFAFAISARSSVSVWSALKGQSGDSKDAWLTLFWVAMAFGLYLGLGYVFIEIIMNLWNSFGAFSTNRNGIELMFVDAFVNAEQQDASFWEIAKEGMAFFIFLAADMTRIGYMVLTLFLKYAHAILFAFLFMTGPIVIPLVILKQFDFTKGWALGWKVVIFWPIIEVALRTMSNIPFQNVADIMAESTASGGEIKIIIFTSMIFIYCIAGAIAIMVPFLTNAIVTGAGVVASAVGPMVGGAIVATGLLGSAAKSSAQAGGSAVGSALLPTSARNALSTLNQNGPAMMGNSMKTGLQNAESAIIKPNPAKQGAAPSFEVPTNAPSESPSTGGNASLDTSNTPSSSASSTASTSSKQSPNTVAPSSSLSKVAAASLASTVTGANEEDSIIGSATTGAAPASTPPTTEPKKSSAAKQARRGAMVNKAKTMKKGN